MEKKLYKSATNRKFDGVCAGVAQYFNIDPTLVRLIWALFLFTGSGFVAYVLCMLIIPREPEGFDAQYPPVGGQKPPQY